MSNRDMDGFHVMFTLFLLLLLAGALMNSSCTPSEEPIEPSCIASVKCEQCSMTVTIEYTCEEDNGPHWTRIGYRAKSGEEFVDTEYECGERVEYTWEVPCGEEVMGGATAEGPYTMEDYFCVSEEIICG